MSRSQKYLRIFSLFAAVGIPFLGLELWRGIGLSKRAAASAEACAYPYLMVGLAEPIEAGGIVLPALGGISKVETVLGDGITYRADRHGFNNPDEEWEKQNPVVLIGDSFVQGFTVEREATIAGVMRSEGIDTLGLGMGGNGPLLELATVAEFQEPLAPRKVFSWDWGKLRGQAIDIYWKEKAR